MLSDAKHLLLLIENKQKQIPRSARDDSVVAFFSSLLGMRISQKVLFRRKYLQFLNVGKGSAGEVRCLMRVAIEVGYLDKAKYEGLRSGAIELSSYLANPIKSLRRVA